MTIGAITDSPGGQTVNRNRGPVVGVRERSALIVPPLGNLRCSSASATSIVIRY